MEKYYIEKGHKTYFEIWWAEDTKVLALYNYKVAWKREGIKPHFNIRTNGAKKKNGDSCLDFTITLGYLVFNYCNYNLQGEKIK